MSIRNLIIATAGVAALAAGAASAEPVHVVVRHPVHRHVVVVHHHHHHIVHHAVVVKR
jgi:hypothetical protein